MQMLRFSISLLSVEVTGKQISMSDTMGDLEESGRTTLDSGLHNRLEVIYMLRT